MILEELISDIKSSLGYPIVEVYMDDQMIEDQIKIALKKFAANIFHKEIRIYDKAPVIKMDKDDVAFIVSVSEVDFRQNESDISIYDADEFTIAYQQQYLSSLSESGVGISPYLNAKMFKYQFIKMSGNKLDWDWDDHEGKLYVSNYSPTNGSKISVVLKTYYVDIDQIEREYETWFFDYCLALCKIVEGTIRSKYEGVIPNAPTDGNSMKEEGKTERDQLRQDLLNLVPFDIGFRE